MEKQDKTGELHEGLIREYLTKIGTINKAINVDNEKGNRKDAVKKRRGQGKGGKGEGEDEGKEKGRRKRKGVDRRKEMEVEVKKGE